MLNVKNKIIYLGAFVIAFFSYLIIGNPRLLLEYYSSEQIRLRLRLKQLRPLNNKLQQDLVLNLLLIEEDKSNVSAWMTLAKIYELQNQYNLAQDAYYNLSNLEPDNKVFFKQFIKMMLKDTKKPIADELREKITYLLAEKEDMTYLNLLAMDAYNAKNIVLAQSYWQRMYNLAKKEGYDQDTLIEINKLLDACKSVSNKLI